jgi:hypothetical protein
MMIDAIIKTFGLDNSISPGDNNRKTRYVPIDPHHWQSEISGHWNGWNVSHQAGRTIQHR